MEKRKLPLIDILRIVCVCLIYMRHSITMFGCHYINVIDILTCSLTGPVMTCFFILSGFSIHYQHRSEIVTDSWLRLFLKKRLISIMPSYLLVALIWPIAYRQHLNDWILLLPIDLFGIQTAYRTLFGILHNGGTWFVSCILFCYVLYPVMKSVMSNHHQEDRWTSWLTLIIAHFLLMYSYVIISAFKLDVLYSNPIARAGEFLIGVSFAEIVFGIKKDSVHKLKDKWGAIYCILLLTSISITIALLNRASLRIMAFAYLTIPFVLLILYTSTLFSLRALEKNKVLATLSGMSYQFFLAQLFIWKLTGWMLKLLQLHGNIAKLMASFILCICLSFITWKFYDKPIRKVLSVKLISRG